VKPLLLLTALSLHAATQPGPCTASGVVVHDATGQPVPFARLVFQRIVANTYSNLGFFTDQQGRFQAFSLDPASYTVVVTKAGLLPPLRPELPLSSTTVDLRANCQTANLQYLLVPAAIISGRITDHLGQPIPSARVEAQRRTWLNGRWSYRTIASTYANAQGSYRIASLPAGQYVLRAHPQGPVTVSFSDPAGPTTYLAPAYYPNSFDAAQAQPIGVATGSELAGYDFGPVLTPLLKVEGRLGSAEGQSAPSFCTVILRSKNNGGDYTARYTPETGAFSFAEIPPGDYRLMAYASEATSIGSALREITLVDRDMTGIQLDLAPPITVKGKAALQGGTLPSQAIWVNLSPLIANAVSDGSVWIGDEGSFEFNVVQYDRYRLSLGSTQPNIYLKSVTVAGKPVQGTVLDWSAGQPANLQVLLANDGGRLEGTVTEAKPLDRSLVVLVPADMTKLAGAELFTEFADNNQKFRLANLPPGDYLAFAFAFRPNERSTDPAMFSDPGWVPSYPGKGTPVRIQPNAAATATLPAQSPP
jgi:hypothetical protein